MMAGICVLWFWRGNDLLLGIFLAASTILAFHWGFEHARELISANMENEGQKFRQRFSEIQAEHRKNYAQVVAKIDEARQQLHGVSERPN